MWCFPKHCYIARYIIDSVGNDVCQWKKFFYTYADKKYTCEAWVFMCERTNFILCQIFIGMTCVDIPSSPGENVHRKSKTYRAKVWMRVCKYPKMFAQWQCRPIVSPLSICLLHSLSHFRFCHTFRWADSATSQKPSIKLFSESHWLLMTVIMIDELF